MTKMATTKMGTDLYFGNKSTPFLSVPFFAPFFMRTKRSHKGRLRRLPQLYPPVHWNQLAVQGC